MIQVNGNDRIMQFVPLWGNWVPDALIGEGAYGRVYRVHRIDDPRYVSAVKHIRIPKDESERAEAMRMGLEGESLKSYFNGIASRISHEIELMYALRGEPNIVSYEDHQIYRTEEPFGIDIFMRMELLIPLSDYSSNNPLAPDDVKRLGVEICAALEACEAYGIIHRDIKEGNVFLNSRGNFKLGDFGIARELSSGTGSAMSMRGTPAYIAPEVYLGRNYDASVDLYSLGILMYKLLNDGRYPFIPPAPQPVTVNDTENAFSMRMAGRIPPFPAHGDGALRAAVMRAIAYDSAGRFGGAAQMKRALEAGTDGTVLPWRPFGPGGDTATFDHAETQNVNRYGADAPPAANAKPEKKKSPAVAIVLGVISAVLLAALIAVLTGGGGGAAMPQSQTSAAAEDPAAEASQTAAAVETEAADGMPDATPEPTETPAELMPVEFEDAKFESLIRQLLNRPTGDILGGELESITSLTILGDRCMYETYDYFAESGNVYEDGGYDYYGVKNARGSLSNINDLRFFPNLTELNIACTEITDISVLYQLPKIETLRLTSNIFLSDISPIASLANLMGDLQLFMNDIYDLSPLAGCYNLVRLTVSSNRISDLKPIAGLTKLVYLNLYRNQITDISPLAGLVNLENLRINVNSITDISPLRNLTKLRELRMNGNAITDISPLSGLTALEVLYMQNNSVTSIYVLGMLPNLKTVNVRNNPIYDYSPLWGISDASY